jgi:protein-disulfide isomerase
LAVIGGALVLVVALVVGSRLGNDSSKPSATNIELDSIEEMLSGIPQKGIVLGNPKAKLTLVEFSDPQCPWCGEWARKVFPTLVDRYVQTGKLRIEYSGVVIANDDSTRMIRLAQAAGLQNKLWNVVELEFENQGTENSGYATDAFLKGIVKAVPGLDADKALSDADTSAVVPMIDAAQKLADQSFKTLYTPSFLLGRTGSKQTVKIVGAQSLETFTNAIDAQLKK